MNSSVSNFTRQYETEKELCFILMPFAPEYQEIYDDVLKPIITELKIKCVRADDIRIPGVILDQIWEHIQKAEFIIADLTGHNPNVFYELALCNVLQKQVILITQDISTVPFDLQHMRLIEYDQSINGGTLLSNDIRRTIEVMRAEGSNSENTIIHKQGYNNLEEALANSQETLRKLTKEVFENTTMSEETLRELFKALLEKTTMVDNEHLSNVVMTLLDKFKGTS